MEHQDDKIREQNGFLCYGGVDLRHDVYYIVCPYGIGDTFYAAALVKSLKEFQPDIQRVCMVVKEGHRQIPDWFEAIDEKLVSNEMVRELNRFSIRTQRWKLKNYLYAHFRKNSAGQLLPEFQNCEVKNMVFRYKRLVFHLPDEYGLDYPQIASQNGIQSKFMKEFSDGNKTIIFIPYAQSTFMIADSFWEGIAKRLADLGYRLFTNVKDKEEMPVKGTKALCVDIESLVAICERSRLVISIRNGLCDVLAFAKVNLVVLNNREYHFREWNLKDAVKRENIYSFLLDGTGGVTEAILRILGYFNMKAADGDIVSKEEIREYFFHTLPKRLEQLPLNTDKRIGIYGLGVHTDRLLEQYKDKIGDITADVIMVDSRRATNGEKHKGYEIWNVKDIGEAGLGGLILSSSIYEKEMYRTIRQLYPDKFPVYRFYETNKDDIFLYKGIYLAPGTEEKRVLKIGYADMWPSFFEGANLIADALAKKYLLEISEEPDILFCGQFGDRHKEYHNCKKVLLITEPFRLCFNSYDYAIGFPYLEGENYLHYNPYAPRNPYIQYRGELAERSMADRKFCNFIYSQEKMGEGARLRKTFCMSLAEYRHIDCPGRVLNNMQNAIAPRHAKNQWESKSAFLAQYKFTIAFENSSIPGYTTEKLWQPFLAGSIPIYWGNPMITQEVNPEAFINCNDYDNDFSAVIKRVKEIDEDDELYLAMLRKAPMKENYDFSSRRLEEFLDRVVSDI